MATFNEFFKQYDRVRALSFTLQAQTSLLQDEVNRGAVLGDPDFIGNRVDQLDSQINASIDFLNLLSEQIASSDLPPDEQASLQDLIETTGNVLLDTQQQLVSIRAQAQNNQNQQQVRQQSTPKNSAGEIVGNEQDARDNDANVQSPPQEDVVVDQETGRVVTEPENTNTGTNARTPNTEDDVDSNTDSAVGNEASGGATSSVGGDRETVDVERTQAGDVAASDDEVTDTPSAVGTSTGSDGRPTVAQSFLDPITPKPNLLSGLSSMTYTFGLYLMSPGEYAQLVSSQEKILTTKQLLIQSAGASNEERNEWFNVDFYLEDLHLESVVGTQDAGSPHNVTTLDFTVVEPQGITFLNRLNNAVIDHITGSEEETNAFAQTYLLVIRFYGYDAAGNVVTASDLGLPTTSDQNAIQEKFIPFVITGFNYKIATKSTEYKISGACTGTNIAFSTQRGTIPFNIQLSASTIDQLFNGNKVLAGDPNNNGTETVVQGLVDALNQHQVKLATPETDKPQSYAIPDQYEFVFQNDEIKNAKVLQPGSVNKSRAVNQTAVQAAKKYLESQLNYDPKSKTYNILAGTQIVQLLDLVLRTSSFVTSQQNIVIDEKTGKTVEQPNSKPMLWYRIKTKIEPRQGENGVAYDVLRKTIAYKITYLISEYQINTPRSPYFPRSKYYGTHKLYNYWFTGQNTEVLDFEIDVNSNYFVIIGNDGYRDTNSQGKFPVQQSYSSAPGQSLQGGSRNSTAPAANLSDRLYNIADVASAELEIVGDPDWIQQSELIYNSSITTEAFCPDGSMNYDSREVLFELRFNPVTDYSLQTGLVNVYENNRDFTINGVDQSLTQTNIAQESLVWCATTVSSSFVDGKFTQRLRGVIRDFASSIPPDPTDEVINPTETSSTANTLNNQVIGPTYSNPVDNASNNIFTNESIGDD